jgi:hypothetical protein
MKKYYLLFLFLLAGLLSPAWGFEDEEKEEALYETQYQVLSLTEVVALIQKAEDEIFLQDIIIRPGASDSQFLIDKLFFKVYEIVAPEADAVSLYLYNCQFDFDEADAIVFKAWQFERLNLIGVKTTTPLAFEDCYQSGIYPIRIENSHFNNKLSFVGSSRPLQHLRIHNSVFYHQLQLGQDIIKLQLHNNHFDADPTHFSLFDEESTHYQMEMGGIQIADMDLSVNSFDNKGIDNLYSINMSGTKAEKVRLLNLNAHTINLTDASFEKSFLADSLQISHVIAVQNFDFPVENTNLPWYNIGGEKLCIFLSEGTEKEIPYRAKSSHDISRTLFYNELMASYNKINSMYDVRGDKVSANASYIEIKDIETRQRRYMYELHGDLNHYLGYQLNLFAKYSSDYATNPAKSLQIILWVILIFAILYMFTYSEWDGINFAYLEKQYFILSEYFMTDKSLKDLYLRDIGDKQAYYERLKGLYKEKKTEIPFSVRVLGSPLYSAWQIRQKLTFWLYDRIEFMHGSWNSLDKNKKFTAGLITVTGVLIYSLFLLAVKFINSFLLSMNMFVSLGFGKTPEQIIPMYISIIQGFIGWFMLTVFTITLLSQMLQNF